MDKELTPKQQTSEAIRQADTILILTGQHPSVDQVAATLSLTTILRKFGKKVTAVISDEIPSGAQFLAPETPDKELGGLRDFIIELDLTRAEVDKLKYNIDGGKLNIHVSPFAGGFEPRDVSFSYGEYQYDLVLVLGVASYSRIDRIYAKNSEKLRQIPLINIDFHRSNEQYGAINLVDPAAASLSEILVALSESLQTGLIDTNIATALLAGIMGATDRFTATHTTSKSLTVAAQMMAMGADQQKVVRGLYRDKGGQRPSRNIEKNADRATQNSGSTERQKQPMKPVEPEVQPIQASTEINSDIPTANAPEEPVSGPMRSPRDTGAKPVADDFAPVAAAQTIEKPAESPIQSPKPQPAPELESDGPAVTDPDLPQPQAAQTMPQPEPLINSQDPQPEAAKPKASNPTNNPVFANRIPW